MFGGVLLLAFWMQAGAGAEITTWPLLLVGVGVGALASQLGSVTVSSLPDERSGEVGGLQNTSSNLGTSIGTAVIGSVLIATLTTSFLHGVTENPAVPESMSSQASVELVSGVEFVSDDDLSAALDQAGVSAEVADAIVEENADARVDALRGSLVVLAGFALLALFFTGSVPTVQAADEEDEDEDEPAGAGTPPS
jgi:hypothetical protein